MAIPDRHTPRPSLLRHRAEEGQGRALRDLATELDDDLRLTPAARTRPLGSGAQPLTRLGTVARSRGRFLDRRTDSPEGAAAARLARRSTSRG